MKAIELECDSGTVLRLTYRPRVVKRIQARDRADEGDCDRQIELLCDIIAKWDLTGPLPLTATGNLAAGALVAEHKVNPPRPEMLKHIPIPFLKELLDGIVDDAIARGYFRRRA